MFLRYAKKLERLIVHISAGIWVVRAPLIVSLVGFWFLKHEQLQEAYTALVWSIIHDKNYWPLIWAAGSLVVVCGLIFLIARDLTVAEAADELQQKTATGLTLRNLPGALAIIPLLGAIIGIRSAYAMLRENDTGATVPNTELIQTRIISNALPDMTQGAVDAGQISAKLTWGFWTCVAIAIVAAALILWRSNRHLEIFKLLSIKTHGPRFFVCFAVLLGVVIWLGAAEANSQIGPVIIATVRRLGPILVLNAFLLFFGFFLAALVLWYDRRGFPFVTLLIIGAAVASYFGWNENHSIRLLYRSAELADKGAASDPPLRPLSLEFLDWFDARPEERKCAFLGNCDKQSAGSFRIEATANEGIYPVYIVAAEGGGMYAAQLTAIALARLYDRCPALRHHIFAVSGVSGGSIGAGLISALLNQQTGSVDSEKCDVKLPTDRPGAATSTTVQGILEGKVRSFLDDDFLSPLGLAGLFPDFFQRFFPLAPIGAFDRARAFEASLEASWETNRLGEANPLREGFRRQWRAAGPAPMLALNTTSVENGQSVVVAPFLTHSFAESYAGDLKSIYEDLSYNRERRPVDEIDLSLATAMSLSARFPIIMPHGSINLVKGRVNRYVDGGYVENSGVDTALLMIRNLQFFSQHPESLSRERSASEDEAYKRIEFRVLILNEWYKEHSGRDVFRELTTPPLTLYKTRLRRAESAINRSRVNGVVTHMLHLDHRLFTMNLAWQLSAQTDQIVTRQIGQPDECVPWQERIGEENKLREAVNAAKGDIKRLIQFALLRNDNACEMMELISEIMLPSLSYQEAIKR